MTSDLHADPADVTSLLVRWQEGEAGARDRAAEAVYPELRRIAAAYLERERAEHTLQPTALVHEAFLKLVDAGLAAFTGGGRTRRLAASDPSAIAASDAGVVRYLSPEQALGQTGDARSDLFALGSILYEMLTGKPAFDRPTAEQTVLAVVAGCGLVDATARTFAPAFADAGARGPPR